MTARSVPEQAVLPAWGWLSPPRVPVGATMSLCHVPWGHGRAWLAPPLLSWMSQQCGDHSVFWGCHPWGVLCRCPLTTHPSGMNPWEFHGTDLGTRVPLEDRKVARGVWGRPREASPAPVAASPAEPRTCHLISRQVLLMDHLLFLVSRAINSCHLTAAS